MSDLNNTGLLYSATPTKIDPTPINQEEKKDMVKEPEATSSASASSGKIRNFKQWIGWFSVLVVGQVFQKKGV